MNRPCNHPPQRVLVLEESLHTVCGTCGETGRIAWGRAPVAAGVLIDEEPSLAALCGLGVLARSVFAIALVAFGAMAMYWEGQHQPAPGVLFAVGLTAIVGAALLIARDR